LYRQALGKDSKAVKKDAIGAGVGHGVSLFTYIHVHTYRWKTCTEKSLEGRV
jgi:hypothetical protein